MWDQVIMTQLQPYYETELGKLYHGDCLEIIPGLEPVDLIITDPPYEKYENYDWEYVDLKKVINTKIRSFVFWKGSEFPLPYTARHIWAKANRNIGKFGEQYEELYEINGKSSGLVLRHAVIDSVMNAQLNSDVFTKHPTQKPFKLIFRILLRAKGDLTLDPFLGSGTTAVCCERLKRKWIGIEISEEYCEIATKRIEQERKQLKLF
jgi:DNA modification methylase